MSMKVERGDFGSNPLGVIPVYHSALQMYDLGQDSMVSSSIKWVYGPPRVDVKD